MSLKQKVTKKIEIVGWLWEYPADSGNDTAFTGYTREWEGTVFEFTISVKNDSLVQRGIEKPEKVGINRFITETYIRVTGN